MVNRDAVEGLLAAIRDEVRALGRERCHAEIVAMEGLQKLTGYVQPVAIKGWLRSNGVPFMVQAAGHPVTTLEAINQAMFGSRKLGKPDFSSPLAKFGKRCRQPGRR